MDLCRPYDENLDHLRISTFLSEYKEDLIADSFTLDNVQKKKEYLLAKWREQSSQQLQELTRDSQKLDEKIRLYNNLEDKIKRIKIEASSQKKKIYPKVDF